MKKHLLKLGIALAFLCFSTDSFATHFRYGTMTYEVLSETGSGTSKQTTVKFTINQGWRRSFSSWGSVPIGGTVNTSSLNFGDGTSTTIGLTITAINFAEDWFLGTFTTTHTYTGNVDVTAFMSNCCRISTLQGGNANDSYRNEAVVTLSETTNENPISSLPAIVNVPINQSGYTFNLNAIDPNGDAITYALSTAAQSQLSPNNPTIFTSINSNTGEVTLNTTYSGVQVGHLWAIQFMMTDSKGATSPIDFIIRIAGTSNPPVAISPTPANGTTYKVTPGSNVNFTVAASDPDVGDVVTLLGSGIPIGATFSPGTPANPISAAFSWTPTMADLGAYSVTFSATDGNFAQSLTTINIIVSLAPLFDIPPTPATATHLIVEPNNNISFTVKATDPDPADQCQITSVMGKNHMGNPIPIYSGVTFNPAIPTTAGNSSQTVVSWTPTQAQWGHRHMFFTATDGFNDQTTHEVSLAVNTPPSFQSSPVMSACEGQLYTYNITVTDPDLAQGDYTKIYGITVPGWLTFTDNGNGTATLSGTPGIGDIGANSVMLNAQDSLHHHGGMADQNFSINVTSCNNPPPPPPACPTTNTFGNIWINSAYKAAGANDPQTYYWGLSNGTITAKPTGGTAPYTYNWYSGAGYSIKNANKKRARLWYPTGPQWVYVDITDATNCTVTDSIYIDWVDFTCNQPLIWWYQLCDINSNTPLCVKGTANMRSLVQTGDYVFGNCNQPAKTAFADNSSNSMELGLNVFPNPNNGAFTITLSNTTSAVYDVKVLDMNGRVLFADTFNSTDNYATKELQLDGLAAGMYMVHISDGNSHAVERIVIQ